MQPEPEPTETVDASSEDWKLLAQLSQSYRGLLDTFMDQIGMHRAQANLLCRLFVQDFLKSGPGSRGPRNRLKIFFSILLLNHLDTVSRCYSPVKRERLSAPFSPDSSSRGEKNIPCCRLQLCTQCKVASGNTGCSFVLALYFSGTFFSVKGMSTLTLFV